MRKQIVIVGHAPASQFLAELLDQTVARLVQVSVVWLTDPSAIAYLPANPSVLTRPKLLGEQKLLHVKRRAARVRSISLVDRKVTTEQGTLDYDYLILDQGQATTEAELLVIRRELTTLAASLKAGTNTGQSRQAAITVNGDSADRLQLAVAIAADLKRHFPAQARRIKVRLDCQRLDEALEAYLRANGLERFRARTETPGLTIAASAPFVAATAVRGLTLDRAGHAVTNHGRIETFPEVLILDSHDRPWQTLLRFERTMARRVAKSVERVVDGQAPLPLQLHGQAYLLTGRTPLVRLGSMHSGRWRARAVLGLERRLLAGR